VPGRQKKNRKWGDTKGGNEKEKIESQGTTVQKKKQKPLVLLKGEQKPNNLP